MPSERKMLVALRGTEEYAAFLDRLLKRLARDGVPLSSRHELAEHALAELARRLNIKPPRRIPPQGTNRHGEPRETG